METSLLCVKDSAHISCCAAGGSATTLDAPASPQIPQTLSEVDNGKILGFGADLAEDHPVRLSARAWLGLFEALIASSLAFCCPVSELQLPAGIQRRWLQAEASRNRSACTGT